MKHSVFFFHMISCYSLFINCLLFDSLLMELLLIFQAMDPQESQLNFQSLKCINELLGSMYFVPPSTIPRITVWLDIFPRLYQSYNSFISTILSAPEG